MDQLARLPDIQVRIHRVEGALRAVTEIYLIGSTKQLRIEDMQALPGVESVVRVSEEYRVLGRHKGDDRPAWFDYQGLRFGQDTLHIFAGLCAVDTPEHVEQMCRALQQNGQVCTRMGAYKPRTSPYAFQGHGRKCLNYVFEIAGKYGIKVIAMEITHESHLDEIREALRETGSPTGAMVQIGTRNTQNFELLKAVGRQNDFPVLIKRGFGITLDESLNAAEYLASEGNRRVVFGLRGMKTNMGDPHRNFVDFSHVPVVRRLTQNAGVHRSVSFGGFALTRSGRNPGRHARHCAGRGGGRQHGTGGLSSSTRQGAGGRPAGAAAVGAAALHRRC